MNCQILFSGKNKINVINVSSAELAESYVKIKQTCSNFRTGMVSS